MDNLDKIFEFTKKSEQLKLTKRWLNTATMKVKETGADHSWHLALLVPIVAKELEIRVDVNKAILIALVHDLVEALAGDTDYSLIAWGIKSVEEKHKEEVKAIEELAESLPPESGKMIKGLWQEYDKAETEEARFVKALDKIETINHMIVLGPECFDHPELIAPYPVAAVEKFPQLKSLLEKQQEKLKLIFGGLNWEWKKEYEPAK